MDEKILSKHIADVVRHPAAECKSELLIEHSRSEGYTIEVLRLSPTSADFCGVPHVSEHPLNAEEQYWLEQHAREQENLIDLARVHAEGDAAAQRYLMSVFSSVLLIGMGLIILIGLLAAAM